MAIWAFHPDIKDLKLKSGNWEGTGLFLCI